MAQRAKRKSFGSYVTEVEAALSRRGVRPGQIATWTEIYGAHLHQAFLDKEPPHELAARIHEHALGGDA